MGFCGNCGFKFEVSTRFCQQCGAAVSGGSALPANPPTATSAPSKVRQVFYTDKGAVVEFQSLPIAEVANLVNMFFAQMGFRFESGNQFQAIYGKGSAAGRVLGGGFVKREKYSAKFADAGQIIRVEITSEMSGAGGGLVGYSREQNARNNFKQSLSFFLSQVSN